MYDVSHITPERMIVAPLDKKDQFSTLAKQEKWGLFIVGESQVIAAAKAESDSELHDAIRDKMDAYPALFDAVTMRTADGEDGYSIEPMSIYEFAFRVQQDMDDIDLTGRKKKALHPFTDLDVALGRYLDATKDMASCVETGT